MSLSVYQAARQCLQADAVEQKLQLTLEYARRWREEGLAMDDPMPPAAITRPGRPARPVLVDPAQVPRRGLGTVPGRAALIHAVTHIEFNAIDLAWDAVYRFREHPPRYVADWIKVADEEAYHFTLLRERLWALGYDYGDFPAHNGLWEMAQKTDFDPMVRMALVPRVLEARGLDVTPGMMQKLQQVGDLQTVEVLRIILRDEIGHVEIGSRWFKYHCDQRGLDMRTTFKALVQRYFNGGLRGPFHLEARKQAGFSDQELQDLRLL